MAIYRGAGGTTDTTDQATVDEVTSLAASAASSASSASSSASSASTSASTATTQATNAETSATNAASSATTASQSKDDAVTAQLAAEAAQVAAESAQASAETAKDTAVTYGSNAVSANTTAQAAKVAAETARDVTKGYRDEVLTSEVDAAGSAIAAAASATSAASSASAASTSATAAAASESTVAASATSAANSATASASSATAAAASETAAAASESAAATSETNASGSATAAASSASAASTSATTATTKASEAATSATNASTSATNASASESAAATSATAANAAKDAALAALDSFDDRYLGVKTSDPTLDNDGNALVSGALYFDSVAGVMKVYDGSTWLAAYADLSGALIATNNLSDLTNVVTARSSLGLGTAATTASTDYATAAQGALADSAIQAADLGTAAYTASTAYATAAQGTLADSALQSFTETDPVFTAWDKSTGISITESQISDFGSYQPSGSYAASVHGHAISDVTGLQTALDGKVDDAQVLTNVPAGAVFTDTTYSVGDGGLTEINFTSARSSKLDGIEAGATADQIITAGSGLTGGGTGDVTLSHADTSAQTSVNNSGTTFIQDVTLDTYGHVTGLASATITIPTAFASGTAMLFQQTSAPTGWTKSTTHNNKALRVVSGTASSGGSTAFTTAFGTPSVSGTVGISGAPAAGNLAVSMSGNIAVGNTTLSVNTIPSHSHNIYHVVGQNSNVGSDIAGETGANWANNPTGNTGGNGAHGHSASHNLSGVLNGAPSVGNLSGSLSSATAAINVQYVDIIIATKD